MKSVGFNALRIPLSSNGVLHQYEKTVANSSVAACRSLPPNASSWDVLDALVKICENETMYLILDMHRIDERNQNMQPLANATALFTSWQTVLARYKSSTNLIGVEIFNEPHGTISFDQWNATIERFMQENEEVLRRSSSDKENILVFIDGMRWGEDFRDFAAAATQDWILPYRDLAVLSPHSYGPRLTNAKNMSEAALRYHWHTYYGFLMEKGWTLAITEWGFSTNLRSDHVWADHFIAYLLQHHLSWFFWSWNPYNKDVDGFLEGDWKTASPSKLTTLASLLA